MAFYLMLEALDALKMKYLVHMVKVGKCALMHKKWTFRVELTKKTSHCKSRDFLRKRRLKINWSTAKIIRKTHDNIGERCISYSMACVLLVHASKKEMFFEMREEAIE